MRIIRGFNLDLSDIDAAGEVRPFRVTGTNGAVFSLMITNEDDHYYNFSTKTFAAAESKLKHQTISSGVYSGDITFPAVGDNDHYNIYLFAEPQFDTKHTPFIGVRFPDGTLDINSSTGSNSTLLQKKIYQYTDVTITLTAVTPKSLAGFGSWSLTTDTITTSRGKNIGKTPFTIVIQTAIAKSIKIDKKPDINDFTAYVTRTIGSAGDPIEGEDVSGSTYYRWPINNTVGLGDGMILDPAGTNVTAGSFLSGYQDSFTTKTEERGSGESVGEGPAPITGEGDVRVETERSSFVANLPAIDNTGYTPTLTDGVITSWQGKVIFNKKQADALKDDSVKIYAYGARQIETMTGMRVNLTGVDVALTATTTTTTAVVSGSTTVPVTQQSGIMTNVSTVSGIGINESVADPSVTAKGAASGSGNLTLSAAQTLESGITLTFNNASRTATITGNIEITNAPSSNTTLYFDVERFLTAS